MGQRVQLCQVMEGVQFIVWTDEGPVRAVILGDALEAAFGAEASPQGWLAAYTQHEETIDAAVREQRVKRRAGGIVLLRAAADGSLAEGSMAALSG